MPTLAEIDLLKNALRRAYEEIKHQKFCKEVSDKTREVMQLNIDLTEKRLREKESENIILRCIVGN